MKLYPKIFGIGLVGLIIATIISVISIYSGKLLKDIQNEENKYFEFQAELVAAKNAHLLWLQTIDNAIMRAEPEVKIGIDGKLCAFGKWYYSDGARLAEAMPQEFQTVFKNLEANHLKVHRLGGELLALWDPNDLKPVTAFFMEQIVPTADLVIDDLTGLENLCRDNVAEIRQRGEWLMQHQSWPTLITLVIGAMILLPYTWFTVRGIVRPMQIGGTIFQSITEKGRLDVAMPDTNAMMVSRS